MPDATNPNDPMGFLRNLWGNVGMPLPGLVTPTLDIGELDKRITDLKAVEGWLRMNLSMLQMSVQGLEMQRAALATLQAVSQSATGPDAAANPFANPALWPWNLMQPGAAPATEPLHDPDEPEPTSHSRPGGAPRCSTRSRRGGT